MAIFKKLSEALGLDIDVRLAKARSQYLCLKRLDEAGNTMDEEYIENLARCPS